MVRAKVENVAADAVVAAARAALDDAEARYVENVKHARRALDALAGQATGRRPVAVYACRANVPPTDRRPSEVVFCAVPGNGNMHLHIPVLHRTRELPFASSTEVANSVVLDDGDYEAVVLIFKHEKKETH